MSLAPQVKYKKYTYIIFFFEKIKETLDQAMKHENRHIGHFYQRKIGNIWFKEEKYWIHNTI